MRILDGEQVLVRIFIGETEEQIDRLLPILDEMVAEGLVTLEKTRVLKYSPGKRPIGC